MKRMVRWMVVVAAIGAATPAFAGRGGNVNNGGTFVFCPVPGKTVEPILLDVWDGAGNATASFISESPEKDLSSRAAFVAKVEARTFNLALDINGPDETMQARFAKIYEDIGVVDSWPNAVLGLTGDAYVGDRILANCFLTPIAWNQIVDGQIRVSANQAVVRGLGEAQKRFLELHEALYLFAALYYQDRNPDLIRAILVDLVAPESRPHYASMLEFLGRELRDEVRSEPGEKWWTGDYTLIPAVSGKACAIRMVFDRTTGFYPYGVAVYDPARWAPPSSRASSSRPEPFVPLEFQPVTDSRGVVWSESKFRDDRSASGALISSASLKLHSTRFRDLTFQFGFTEDGTLTVSSRVSDSEVFPGDRSCIYTRTSGDVDAAAQSIRELTNLYRPR